MNSRTGFVAMLMMLLAALATLGFRTYQINMRKEALAHKTELKQEEVRDFSVLQYYLLTQVDSLQKVYADLAMNHTATRNNIGQLARREAILKKLTTIDCGNQAVETLKLRVENLLELKESLETDIEKLQNKR